MNLGARKKGRNSAPLFIVCEKHKYSYVVILIRYETRFDKISAGGAGSAP